MTHTLRRRYPLAKYKQVHSWMVPRAKSVEQQETPNKEAEPHAPATVDLSVDMGCVRGMV